MFLGFMEFDRPLHTYTHYKNDETHYKKYTTSVKIGSLIVQKKILSLIVVIITHFRQFQPQTSPFIFPAQLLIVQNLFHIP